MKKRVAILLTLCLAASCISLTACGKKEEPAKESAKEESVKEESVKEEESAEEETSAEEASAEEETSAAEETAAEESAAEETAAEESAKEETPATETSDDLADYIGVWYEEIAGRGEMTITPIDNGVHVSVIWANGAAETITWDFDAYEMENGQLGYNKGIKQSITWDEKGNDTTTVISEESAGSLSMNEPGKSLFWYDEDYQDESTFIKSE